MFACMFSTCITEWTVCKSGVTPYRPHVQAAYGQPHTSKHATTPSTRKLPTLCPDCFHAYAGGQAVQLQWETRHCSKLTNLTTLLVAYDNLTSSLCMRTNNALLAQKAPDHITLHVSSPRLHHESRMQTKFMHVQEGKQCTFGPNNRHCRSHSSCLWADPYNDHIFDCKWDFFYHYAGGQAVHL